MSKQSDLVNVAQDAGTDGYVKVTDASTSGTDYLITSGSRYKFFGSEANNVEIGSYSSSNTSRNVHMSIDSAGNVGIGTSSPALPLEVYHATNSRILASTGSTGASQFCFGDDADDYVGRIYYDHSNNSMRFHANTSEAMRIDSGQQIFAGCTSTSGGVPNEDGVVIQGNGNVKFRVASSGNAANQYYSYLGVNVGSITVGTSSTNFNTSSDYRLKENVVSLTGAADRLAQIPVHRFNFITDPDTTVDGFLAHEVQAFVPEAVHGEKDAVDADGNPEYQGIDQSKLVPLLTAALQEALQKIDALEARVTALETN